MRLQRDFRNLLLAAMTLSAPAVSAEIPLDYYSLLQGKSGAELKNAIHQVIAKDSDIAMLSFGSGTNSSWWGFYLTDRNEDDNTVVDRYSYQTFYYGTRGTSVGGMDIEHSFAKSWWGGDENNGYKDLFNLMPAESSINRSKSDNVMGVVVKVTTAAADNGCTKVGFPTDDTSDASSKVWEPADCWKGDFARSYLYMATAYQDYNWTGDQGPRILNSEDYPTLKPEASALYLEWSRLDPVSDMEVTRNRRVKSIQGNRNPYIDFPNLMEYVWGDSIGCPLDLYTTLKTDSWSGTLIPEGEEPVTLLSCNFKSDGKGDCTVEHTVRPSEIGDVWTNSSSTGWIGLGSKSKGTESYEADARLVTPEIDLTHYHNANFTFEHSVNYCTDFNPAGHLSVAVRTEDGQETVVGDIRWPHGNATTFYPTHRGYFNSFGGRKVRLVFHYTSDSAIGARWAIRNLVVKASGYSEDPIELVKPGDINGDGAVDIADVTMLINFIISASGYDSVYDVDKSGTIDIADISALIDIIVNS